MVVIVVVVIVITIHHIMAEIHTVFFVISLGHLESS